MRKFALALLLCGGSALALAQTPQPLEVDAAIPNEFRARTIEGAPLTLSARPTLVMFFASWCRSCAEVLPRLPALAENVDVIVVSHERRSLIEPHVIEGPTFGQCTGRTAIRWGASAVPTFVVVKDGRVAFFGQGVRAFEQARALLDPS